MFREGEFMDYEKIAQYCRENYADDVSKTMEIADNVLNNVFLFNMPWDMEATQEPVSFKSEDAIDWLYKPSNDMEFTWQFNRHRFLINLAQAYRLSGDERYAKKIVSLIEHWIDNVKISDIGALSKAWRVLETGLRANIWIFALRYLEGTEFLTTKFLDKVALSLKEHAESLVKNYQWNHNLSNWGVIQMHGLFAIGLYLGERDLEKGYLKVAIDRLIVQGRTQVMADGVHWEASPMYHTEVLKCHLDAIINARIYGVELPEEIITRTHEMAKALLKWMKPNGNQPNTGDSDYTNLMDMLSLCAYLFEDGELKYKAYSTLDYESAWVFGMDGVKKYDAIQPKCPDYLSIDMHDSGNFIMRSSWKDDANYLHFVNGYTGGGHAHCDKLHFDLTIGGEDILIDSGRYTYVPNRLRFALKGASAHNTLRVDGRDFVRYFAGGWGLRSFAPALKSGMLISKECEIVGGAHLGYICKKVVPERIIIWLKPDIYVIIDAINAKGIHKYDRYFHFSPDAEVAQEENYIFCKVGDVKTRLYDFSGSWKIKDTKYSYHYNELKDNKTLKTSKWALGGTIMPTIIMRDSSNVSVSKEYLYAGKQPISDRLAMALSIKDGKDEYMVLYCNKELVKYAITKDKLIASGRLAIYKNGKRIANYW